MNLSPKIVAVVPIKLNSRRFPQKNIKPFTNGRALCWYIFTTLLRIDSISEIYVYCSNSRIKEYIPQGIRYLNRPEVLDSDDASMSEILRCFAKAVRSDIYLMTHVTAPFISAGSIKKGLSKVVSGEFDSAFAARKVQDFLWCENKPLNYSLDNIPRTQDLPVIYLETSGFYIYSNEVIINEHRRIGYRPYIVEVGEIESIDIDEAEDFAIADAVFNFYYSTENEGEME